MTADPMNPLVIEGQFWLPDQDRRFYGRIEYDQDQGIRLHFVDAALTRRRRENGCPDAPARAAQYVAEISEKNHHAIAR